MKLHCEYCGNTSGKSDTWGGCISCGAKLSELPTYSMYMGQVMSQACGWLSPIEARAQFYTPATCPPPKREESIRDMVRRAVGLV